VERPFLSVAMPALNEEAILADSVATLTRALDGLDRSWELVIVDDGSRDRTPAIAAALAAADPRVRVVTHPARRGIGQAIRTGLREARGEWYLMLPADLAVRLDQLPRYFAAATAAEIVLGVCPERSDYSAYRTLLSRANVWLIQALFRLPYHQYNYVNLYCTAVVQALPLRYTGSAFLYAEIVVRAVEQGARVAEVRVDYVPRAGGRATGSAPRLVLHTGRDMLACWFFDRLLPWAATRLTRPPQRPTRRA
jgi:glycosyltransferase involved in cell wall biosynthesis